MTNFISRDRILEYEMHSSPIVKHLSWDWMQEIAGWYYARKVQRKYDRYLISLIERERINLRLINEVTK